MPNVRVYFVMSQSGNSWIHPRRSVVQRPDFAHRLSENIEDHVADSVQLREKLLEKMNKGTIMEMPKETLLNVYRVIVIPMALYGSECWTLTKDQMRIWRPQKCVSLERSQDEERR